MMDDCRLGTHGPAVDRGWPFGTLCDKCWAAARLIIASMAVTAFMKEATRPRSAPRVEDMPHRQKGCCDRCSDIGRRDVPAIGVAKPPVNDWPTFRVCAACAQELAKPAHGEAGYTILYLSPPR